MRAPLPAAPRRPVPSAVAARATVALALTLGAAAAAHAGGTAELWSYVEATAGDATRASAAGVRRSLGWERAVGGLRLSVHGEADLGVWRAGQADGSHRAFAQATLAPVLRLDGGRWFGEVGAGPTWLAPAYRSRQRAFASRLQFRDHLAVGARFGAQGEHALDLRLEHVSNAGIAKPNPGLELLGVRYARRW